MKRVFAILLTAMLLTGCTSENVRAIRAAAQASRLRHTTTIQFKDIPSEK